MKRIAFILFLLATVINTYSVVVKWHYVQEIYTLNDEPDHSEHQDDSSSKESKLKKIKSFELLDYTLPVSNTILHFIKGNCIHPIVHILRKCSGFAVQYETPPDFRVVMY